MKRIFNLFLVLSVLFTFSNSSLANSQYVPTQLEFVQHLKQLDKSSEIENEIELYLSKTARYKYSPTCNKFSEYDIGNSSKIIFFENGSIAVIENNYPKQFGPLKSVLHKKTKSGTTNVDKTFKQYSWLGVKIFSIHLKGCFEYDGNTVKAKCKQGTFLPALLSVWDVDQWNSGSRDMDECGNNAEIYANGTAKEDVEIGVDFSVQEANINASITCDENGNVDESFDIEFE